MQMRRGRFQMAHREYIVNEEVETNVIAFVYVNPTFSVRQVAQEVGTSRQSVLRILKKYRFRSYKYNLHQHLYLADNNRRLEFCQWFTQKVREDRNFSKKIIFTDESRFTNNGMFNRNNLRYWAQENPRLIREGNFQERFGFNVWAGIIGNKIIGPVIFDENLTSERYLNLLRQHLEPFLEDMPLEELRAVYYQHDGAPPHNGRDVMLYLNNGFQDKWIGVNGPVRWPPRSPDLTPVDNFLWGYIKTIVFRTVPETRQELEQKVINAFRTITEDMLHRVAEGTLRRINLCLENQGGHFEHLL